MVAAPSALNPARVGTRDVLFHEILEFLGDALALERHGLGAVLVHRRHRPLAGAGQADAYVGALALARPVDHAAHDRHRHVLDAVIDAAPSWHALAQVALDPIRQGLEIGARGAAATGAG